MYEYETTIDLADESLPTLVNFDVIEGTPVINRVEIARVEHSDWNPDGSLANPPRIIRHVADVTRLLSDAVFRLLEDEILAEELAEA